ncbi:hypothetical protein P152DRAFT_449495 [Eremomyces bilateralis CBS 781.70]|uniref:Uncharacterized protein n=1 Tax=Eremomyces bilateralis CBS 781.70 TaxID=1392243 RepID=A0A6G1G278_9PEZI|nr:uncharacterized protein P152DRAFT_449495 [Eremomyces bilateralis CBS 781.70]KAF1812215.1 hypothetical protein P152DRAFT_449495 [Eremomyces bilateralis CBS 781.70]
MGWPWTSSDKPSSPSSSSSSPPQPSTIAPSTESPPPSTPPQTTTSTSTTTPSSSTTTPPSPLRTATLPTTLSCRASFDSAFYCQSLGGKFNDIYRHGALRSCSDHWAEFWFCMRIKSKDENYKKEAVRDYFESRERERYGAGKRSSEEVWEGRRERVGRAWDWDPEGV